MRETPEMADSALDRALGRAITVNWETVAWVAIVVLALVTRLWGLGDRAMSHDESLHTYYSWKLYIGEGYRHDPMMHGPLLYHATALSYLLFGASDFTARLLAVVTGLGLVMSPLLMRKWLGSAGAVAAGVMFLMSPTIMYYSRYLRHDIPVEFFTVLMVVSFFGYLDSRRGRWIVLAGVGAAGAITSAEMAYINGFVLVTFIVIALASERLGPRLADGLGVVFGALGLGLLLFAMVASTGRIGDVASKGVPLRMAMQLSFLLGGLGLIYSLATLLVGRFASQPEKSVPPGENVLADLTAERFFARYADPAEALLPLISGPVVAVFGFMLGRLLDPASSFVGPARLVLWLGGIVSAYAVAALVLGRVVSVAGRRTNAVLVVFGALMALFGWVLRATNALTVPAVHGAELWQEAVPELPPIAAPQLVNLDQVALILLVGGVVLLIYGLLGWLLEDYETRSLARAVGRVPASSLGVAVAVAAVIYTLLYTTFFTEPDKISGLIDSIAYWLEQHEVVRGDQPWYYYGIFTPMYEFLPLFLSLVGIWVYTRRSGLRVGRGNDSGSLANPSPAARCFVPLTITWATGNFWIYSWAGEKMPWLIVHLAVPLTFLAARLVADTLAAVDWNEMRARGWQIGGLFLLTAVTVVAWLTRQPFRGDTVEELSRTTGWLLGLPVVALLLWAMVRVAGEMSRRQVGLAIALTLAGVLLVADVHYSLQANFVNDELANEYIVYAHGTPDDKLVYNMLRDMQDRVGVDEKLSVAYDNEVSWPFTWYFRHTDWEDAHYVGESPSGTMNEDAVLVGSPNYSKFEPYLRDRYVSIEYRRMWWPNEGYKYLTLEDVRNALTNANARRNWLRILFFRRYTVDPLADQPEDKSLSDWFHHANMRLYVKKDLIERLWPLVQARPDTLAAVDTKTEGPPTPELAIEQVYDRGPDGRPLIAPKDIAVAADGTLYVVDHQQARVVIFDPDGSASGVLADGELSIGGDPEADPSAWGIGLGPDGEVYVADTWNHRILKYVEGHQVGEWGVFGQPAAPTDSPEAFYGPRDVAVGPDGNVYVTDTGNKRIAIFDPDGTPVRGFGGGGIDPGKFDEPTALAFDPATGDLFVADLWNLRIQRLDRDLGFITDWVVDGWSSKEAAHKAYIAVGPGSTVVVSDPAGSRVWIYDNEGNELAALDLLQDEKGLDQPIGVAVDDAGRIYVASSNSGIVTRYAAPDVVLKAAGLDPAALREAGQAEPGAEVEGAPVGESDEGMGESAEAGEAEVGVEEAAPVEGEAGEAAEAGDQGAPSPTVVPSPTAE